MKILPSFSIIIATYNRSYCIQNAIDSVLQQTYLNFEIIVVDDGSSDGTIQKLNQKYRKQINDKRIFLFYKEHSGLSKTRNFGIAHANNDWLVYLDSDNIMDKLYLGVYAYSILQYPTFDFFYSNFKCQKQNKVIGHYFDYNALCNANFIDANTICHHKRLCSKFGMFDENISHSNDWELVLRYSSFKVPKYLNYTLLYYNDYLQDRMSENTKMTYSDGIKIQQQYNIKNIPIITTILLSYNHQHYIKYALESAIKQTGNFIHEIIISDDGSTDNTHQIIEQIIINTKQTDKLKIVDISQKINVGIKKNQKRCIDISTGKYVAFLEGDDIWIQPNRLQNIISFFSMHLDCYMCFSKFDIFDENTYEYKEFKRQNNLNETLTYNDIQSVPYHNPIINLTSCCVYGNILRSSIMLDDNFSEIGFTELPLAYYYLKYGKIGFIKKKTSIYRIHKNGVWQGLNKHDKESYHKKIVDQCNKVIGVKI